MNVYEMYFSPHAAKSFKEIVAHTQEVSLIAAEKLRAKIFHKLHLVRHHPIQGSKSIEVPNIEGNFRLATALNVKIYYKVEKDKILILDLLLDKEAKTA